MGATVISLNLASRSSNARQLYHSTALLVKSLDLCRVPGKSRTFSLIPASTCRNVSGAALRMIVPVTKEEDWRQALDETPEWTPPIRELLVVAPHPDDETLGAGGLIASFRASGHLVTVVAVTDGDRAFSNYPRLAEIRVEEQERALARLGVSSDHIVRLGLPDSAVASREEDLRAQLTTLLSSNIHVVAPWSGDFHPDHEACGRAAAGAVAQTGARLSWYFFWTWHWGTPASLQGLNLKRFPLDERNRRAKAEALRCHQSQLQIFNGEQILPENLLAPAYRPFEIFASA